MIKFNQQYFMVFILLLIIETSIAVFFKQGFIRFVVGDFLAVILLYSLARSFFTTKPIYIAITVLSVAYIVEFLQYKQLLVWLQLEKNLVLKIILGNTFSLEDLVAYTTGIVFVLTIERIKTFS